MKKLLFTCFSLCLAILFALSGCSCTMTQPLVFNKAYIGDGSGNYSEKLEYSVGYESSYQDITNATNIDKDKIPSYSGTFVFEFSNSHNALPIGIKTDIDYEQDYHYLKSSLTLDITLDGKTYNDKIITEVYFHSKDWSLAPVYSKTTMKNTYMALGSEISVDQMIYQYTTLYKKGSYTLTKTYYKADDKEDVNLIDIENTTDSNSPSFFNTEKLSAMSGNGKSYEYEVRRVIDNAQLMFAIRNSDLNNAIPTVSFSYGSPININASNKNQTNYNIDKLIYNGENKDKTNMTVNNIEFSINSTNNRGSSKYMAIQANEVNGIKNNALIVEYAEPVLSGLSNIGALVYKLNKVTIKN